MTPRRPGPAAFTLLEMLVAVALMGVLAGSLGASLYIGFRARERAQAAIEPQRKLVLAMALVRQDIEAALPPSGRLAGAFVGEDSSASSADGASDGLTFHTLAGGGPEDAPDVAKVELVLATPEDRDELALVRRVTRNLLAPETPEPVEEVLCSGVRSLNVRYFDGADWLDSWDSASRDNALPAAVEITIELKPEDAAADDESELPEHTRVFLLPCRNEGGSQAGGVTRSPSS